MYKRLSLMYSSVNSYAYSSINSIYSTRLCARQQQQTPSLSTGKPLTTLMVTSHHDSDNLVAGIIYWYLLLFSIKKQIQCSCERSPLSTIS